ncbi:MAG: hypothetical protein OXM02_02470 [Bacteroidota bacterium]|nr:hypothetical protein [Bacteroidota bacterium]MDE2833367.1 hypothetical protein [Bacteroidota bacterium]
MSVNSGPPTGRMVFVCSPYRADTATERRAHVNIAVQICRHVLRWGDIPLAPHLLYPEYGLLNDDDPAERERGLAINRRWIEQCDALVYYKPKITSGMQVELKVARALNKTIHPVGDDLSPIAASLDA